MPQLRMLLPQLIASPVLLLSGHSASLLLLLLRTQALGVVKIHCAVVLSVSAETAAMPAAVGVHTAAAIDTALLCQCMWPSLPLLLPLLLLLLLTAWTGQCSPCPCPHAAP